MRRKTSHNRQDASAAKDEVHQLLDQMVAWIGARRAEVNEAQNVTKQNKLLQELRKVDDVMRQAYPSRCTRYAEPKVLPSSR
jgi:uncharacterized protein (UPF0276 family)